MITKAGLKNKIKSARESFENRQERGKIINKDFSIISDNCWGAKVYQDLGIDYKTPFVGLFVFSEDYLRLVKNLKDYMAEPLSFTKQSKYVEDPKYPVAILKDIEIHFLHYKDEMEAEEKWNRRKKRINWDNLFFKFNDRDNCTKQLLLEFDNLKYEKKIIFTAKNHVDLKNSIWFKEHMNDEFVEPELKTYKKYFDVVDWLNDGGCTV